MELADALGLGSRELVAFVGAGGKKTAMAALARTADDRDLSVGYTTTTHVPPPDTFPLVLTGGESPGDALEAAPSSVAFAAERVPDPDRVQEKLRGYDPEAVSGLFTTGRFDWLLVKADGARQREFKAPGPDEPVVPIAATRVVPVASAMVIGESLGEPTVHRPERVAAIADAALGETVTPETVGSVLGSEDGGMKGVPSGAVATPLVNKADTPALRGQAERAVRVAIERAGLDYGLVTSFETGYCAVVER